LKSLYAEFLKVTLQFAIPVLLKMKSCFIILRFYETRVSDCNGILFYHATQWNGKKDI